MYARNDVGTGTDSSDVPKPVAVALDEGVECKFGGEVVVRSGENKGRIYLYEGCIAWVTCDTIRARLGDALRVHVKVPEDELREAVLEGRRSGKGFGEVLMEWNLVDAQTLRHVLLEHNAAHFRGILCFDEPLQAMFIPQPRTYSGRLLFTVEELVTAARERTNAAAESSPSVELRLALEEVPDSTIAFMLGATRDDDRFESSTVHELATVHDAVRDLCIRVFEQGCAPLASATPTEVVLLDHDAIIIVRKKSEAVFGMICENVSTKGLSLAKARVVLDRLTG